MTGGCRSRDSWWVALARVIEGQLPEPARDSWLLMTEENQDGGAGPALLYLIGELQQDNSEWKYMLRDQ